MNDKTKAAKILLKAGWDIEEVTEVLGLSLQSVTTVNAPSVWHTRPIKFDEPYGVPKYQVWCGSDTTVADDTRQLFKTMGAS